MAVRILSYETSLFNIQRELDFTLAQMEHQPLAAPHVPRFQGLREQWQAVLLENITILGDLARGQAAVSRADFLLDPFATRVSNAVNEHTSGATRKQLRTALFKDKSLSRFRRPVLAGQLAARRCAASASNASRRAARRAVRSTGQRDGQATA